MIALLVWACLASDPTQCRVFKIAEGFTDERQCGAFAPLMVKGWFDLNPNIEIRDGTRPICSSQANWLMNRFGA